MDCCVPPVAHSKIVTFGFVNFVDELIVGLSSEKDALVLENMVHEKLEEFRIVNDDGATEFFNCTVALAKETVKRLAKKLHFSLTEFKKMNYRGRSSSKIKANLKAKHGGNPNHFDSLLRNCPISPV